MIKLSTDQVLDFLPHRDPFLFIDELLEIRPLGNGPRSKYIELIGYQSVCSFVVRPDLHILKGHFPNNPLLPGVVHIEMMAQASAFIYLALDGVQIDGYDFETILVSVENTKFRKKVSIGDRLIIYSTLKKVRGSIGRYECFVEDEHGRLLSEATILAQIFMEKKKD